MTRSSVPENRQRELAPQPAARATALAARWYVDPEMAALDRRAIFDRGWQLVAHACQLQGAGDHVVADLAGLPVIAVRGGDGAVRVMHNVCRHRAGPIASCDGLAAKSLRCRYHGWTYPRRHPPLGAGHGRAPPTSIARVRLPQLAVRTWQGLVFAAFDEAAAPSFDDFVARHRRAPGRRPRAGRFGLHQRVGYDVACNWKVYVDNYLEGYHVPHIHPGSTGCSTTAAT
jgi:choline monooxygenase